MTITKKAEGSKLSIILEGRLDTTTSPDLEKELQGALDGITVLDFDFKGLLYVSSAGLRVLLSTQKTMNKQGKMTIYNVNNDIMDIFEVTGFTEILNIAE